MIRCRQQSAMSSEFRDPNQFNYYLSMLFTLMRSGRIELVVITSIFVKDKTNQKPTNNLSILMNLMFARNQIRRFDYVTLPTRYAF